MEIEYPCKLKIMTVGKAGSGKTSIMLKFVQNNFKDAHITSIGIDFMIKEISVGFYTITMQIWDVAFSEHSSTLRNSYFKGVNAILIVFDKSNRESFESVNELINNVRAQISSKTILFLVGNKSDLPAEVSTDEAVEKALEFDLYYADISAKTGSQLEMIFRIIANEFLQNDAHRINRIMGIKS